METRGAETRGGETRDRILEAAERVMREKGLARATTKEIARAAGVSEGTLYNYFERKDDLFLCVLRERLPQFVGLIMAFAGRAGSGTVRENLEELARTALAFYHHSVPLGATVFAEPDLLARQRESVTRHGAGPHKPHEAVAAYLRGEQEQGRVRGDADPDAAAHLLLGACFQRAYNGRWLGETASDAMDARFAAGIVAMLLPGLQPED